MTYQLLDLFSGIGGFSLGLERSGNFKTVAFCEIEPFCRSVLKNHWPEVPIYEDVTKLSAERLKSDGITVDAICGGFPCQDISTAGKGAGLEGERSGLWFEFHRLIKETQPKIAIIENVSALRSRGLDQVLRSLSEIGYDAEWHCIPASAVGAPHRRDRIWIMAYSNNQQWWGKQSISGCERAGSRFEFSGSSSTLADTSSARLSQRGQSERQESAEETRTGLVAQFERCSSTVADTSSFGSSRSWMYGRPINSETDQAWKTNWFINGGKGTSGVWDTEPDVGRVAHGVPNRVDRLRALGNAVVPQIPEMIGRVIGDSSN